MKRIYPLVFTFLLLTSCQTLDGIGSDLSTAWTKSGEALSSITARDVTNETPAEKAAVTPEGDVPCPPVKVMDELRTMIEFKDLSKPTAETETGRLTMGEVTARCDTLGGDLAVHLDIKVDGKLGPKARIKATDKPSFAFPYFVAVTGPQGGVLAKEIFAASTTYDAKQETLSQTEAITQHIPLADDGTIPAYSILIGFQLSEEQLTFNRTQPILGATP
jgi:predicted small secreted protein